MEGGEREGGREREKMTDYLGLEKVYDTIPRDITMATLRWTWVPEAEVRMVEGTYEDTQTGCHVNIPFNAIRFHMLRQNKTMLTATC